jgi:Tfp pilus assembly protein PilF
MMYLRRGHPARAKELLQRALAIKEKTTNASDAQFALVLNLLGRVAEMQGAYAEAENFYARIERCGENLRRGKP